MGHADCIGQNRSETGYIFDMRICGRIVLRTLAAFALTSATLQADPGDVESSHDYAAFPRVPGFVITDYDEDNPAEFDFPVAKPLPDDASHVETINVKGHRYVIRYELASGSRVLSLFQTQQYYENLAAKAGFSVAKNGAVGDVTETFYRGNASLQIWVYLEPAITVNVLTIVESTEGVSPSIAPVLATVSPPHPPPATITPATTPSEAPAPVAQLPPPPTPSRICGPGKNYRS
jgi:hypothetical protein